MHSLKYNVIINMLSRVTSILFPLITVPYITRTLAITNYGMVVFSQNIINFFALLASLGISTYATRSGAAMRGNHAVLQRFSSEIFTINILSSFFSLACLAGCVALFPGFRPVMPILAVMSAQIVLATIGCDWVNVIFEDFTSLTVRTILAQCLSVALLIGLVRRPDDYLLYAAIGVFAGGGASVFNAFYIRKYVKLSLVPCGLTLLKKHVRPVLTFFFTQVAITIYMSSDSVLLGLLRGTEEVAFYSISTKIYLVVNSIIYSIISVLLPRFAHVIHDEESLRQQGDKVRKIFNLMLVITVSIIALIFGLGNSIVAFFGGNAYEGAIGPLRILSFATFFSVFAGLYSNCILLPLGREKACFFITVIPAVLNVILNFIFIPRWGAVAAAATTLIAEITCFTCYWAYTRRFFTVPVGRRTVSVAVLGYGLIELICWMFPNCFADPLLHCFFVGAVAGMVYLGAVYVFQREYFKILWGRPKKVRGK